jgi:hypothetical protein
VNSIITKSFFSLALLLAVPTAQAMFGGSFGSNQPDDIIVPDDAVGGNDENPPADGTSQEASWKATLTSAVTTAKNNPKKTAAAVVVGGGAASYAYSPKVRKTVGDAVAGAKSAIAKNPVLAAEIAGGTAVIAGAAYMASQNEKVKEAVKGAQKYVKDHKPAQYALGTAGLVGVTALAKVTWNKYHKASQGEELSQWQQLGLGFVDSLTDKQRQPLVKPGTTSEEVVAALRDAALNNPNLFTVLESNLRIDNLTVEQNQVIRAAQDLWKASFGSDNA